MIFSPRVSVRFNPSEAVNLRVSYAGELPGLFDEDMHIAIVGGKRVRIRLADDLREERSHSVSLSADLYHTFGKVQTNLLVEGFYTILDDVFALRDMDDAADGGKVKERYNGSGATVRGFNVEGRAAFTRWFELQAGVTAEPLQGARILERGRRGAACAPDVPHARCLRLFHRVVQTGAEFHGRPVGNLHRVDAGAAHGRVGRRAETWPSRPRRSST